MFRWEGVSKLTFQDTVVKWSPRVQNCMHSAKNYIIKWIITYLPPHLLYRCLLSVFMLYLIHINLIGFPAVAAKAPRKALGASSSGGPGPSSGATPGLCHLMGQEKTISWIKNIYLINTFNPWRVDLYIFNTVVSNFCEKRQDTYLNNYNTKEFSCI